MNKVCGIYKITSPSGRVYIGQSANCIARVCIYKGAHCKLQTKLYHSIIKYGWEAHRFEIIQECSIDELNDLEIFYIKHYDSFNSVSGLNLRSGGKRPNWSLESRKKLSNTNKGRPSKFKGIPRSEETKQKISKSQIGKIQPPHSEEYKKKMSEIKKLDPRTKTMLGKRHSEETKRKMSASHKGRECMWKYNKRSEETRRKMSESRKKFLSSVAGTKKLNINN